MTITLHKTPQQIFDRYAPGLLMLMLIAALGGVLAHWTWVFVVPRQDVPAAPFAQADTQAETLTIVGAHLFGQATARASGAGTDAISTLNIQLKGVFAAIGNLPGFAVVNTGAKTDQPVRAGDEIMSGVKLESVHPRHIIVNRSGVAERINLEEKGGGGQLLSQPGASRLGVASLGHNAYSVSRGEMTAAFQDGRSGNTGKLKPNPGGGMLVEEASNGSIAEKIGLRQGDVLRQVNGQAVSSLADLSRIYQQLSQVSQIRLDVTRDGKTLQLSYTVQQ